MINTMNIKFIDNPALLGTEHKYDTVLVDVEKTIKSWRASIFSFEWLTPEGKVKTKEQLCTKEHPKRKAIEALIKSGKPIPKAVLGIGTQDNIEIGIGRAHFLTLAAHNINTIPVHIPKSNKEDFKPFLSTP